MSFWLRMHAISVWQNLGLPTCPTEVVTNGALDGRTVTCALRPDHDPINHLSKEGLSWPT